MANLQAAFRAFAVQDISPSGLCRRLNQVICEDTAPSKFITMFAAVLDSAELAITYANAGHNPPLLVSPPLPVRRLDHGGPLLSAIRDAAYEEETVQLEPGTRLLLFTDGVSEAESPGGGEFGEERLVQLLFNSGANGAHALQARILDEVGAFCRHEFHDDATLVTVTVEDSSAPAAAAR